MELSGLSSLIYTLPSFIYPLKKLRQVEKWFRPDDLSHFEPVPVKRLTEGLFLQTWPYTGVCRLQEGPGKDSSCVDEDELDYRGIPALCGRLQQGHTISDLQDRLWMRMFTSIYGMTGAILCMKYWHCAEAFLIFGLQ